MDSNELYDKSDEEFLLKLLFEDANEDEDLALNFIRQPRSYYIKRTRNNSY